MPHTLLIVVAAAMLLATVGCAKKPDDCKMKTSDGICLDNGPVTNAS